VVVVHDQRELVSLRSRLLLSGRLAAVGELAAGVAHEINNPLAYVRSNVALLMEHIEEIGSFTRDQTIAATSPRGGSQTKEKRREDVLSRIDESRELLEETQEGVDRAVSIVRDIKGFSHRGSGERETVDLCELLDSVLRVAAPQLGARLAVERAYSDLPHVRCAPQEIKQVFLNIVLNASQAIDGEGCIRVEAESRGGHVTVRVFDDGPGIPLAVRERVFDPFFTTKPVGKGTGIGLAISYEIVRRHDGRIELTCPEAGGTCAEVRLPIMPGEGRAG
jgi:signal transduction histidine kinase